MKPANIAKARERMTSENWRQFLNKTLECLMMAATNQSSLNKSQIDFLEENLGCSVENRYFVGYFDGSERDEFEDMFERFLLSSSTCFVKKALHSKDLNHKRFSKNGGQFLLFLTEFLLLSIRCGPRRDSIFWRQFCKNLRNAPGGKVLKYLKVFHIKESTWKILQVRNLVYRNTFSNYAFAASPVFEHNGGNVPIQFFGKPFTI